jgi:hypothetical protein
MMSDNWTAFYVHAPRRADGSDCIGGGETQMGGTSELGILSAHVRTIPVAIWLRPVLEARFHAR